MLSRLSAASKYTVSNAMRVHPWVHYTEKAHSKECLQIITQSGDAKFKSSAKCKKINTIITTLTWLRYTMRSKSKSAHINDFTVETMDVTSVLAAKHSLMGSGGSGAFKPQNGT